MAKHSFRSLYTILIIVPAISYLLVFTKSAHNSALPPTMATSSYSKEFALKNLGSFFQTLNTQEANFVNTSRKVMLQVVRPLVTQLGISSAPGSYTRPVKFLDLACGTGVATHATQLSLSPDALRDSTFVAGDQADGMLSIMRKRVEGEGWKEVDIKKMDATNTGLEDNYFSHIAVALALHLIPTPDAVVQDSLRILQPGGTFGASTFARRNVDAWFIPDLRAAFSSLPWPAPLEIQMQMHDSGHWDDAAWVESHLKKLGLVDVEVHEYLGTYRLEGVDEFMSSFEGMIGWLMNSSWSEEVLKEHSVDEVKGLVRKYLLEKYGNDGWDVTWIGIIMTGKKPE